MENTLLNCPLFDKMDLIQIKHILEKYPFKTRDFDKKEFVILQNDICDHLMIILEGKVQAQMVDSLGKSMVVEELRVAQLLAPGFLFSEVNRMPVTLIALENTQILYFKKSVFLEMMQENQFILQNFLKMVSNRAQFLSQRLKLHAFKSIKSKIADYLLQQYKQQNSLQFKLNHTQQELADRFGVTRPSLARSFAELEKEGIIEVKIKNVTLKDLGKLINLI